MTALSLHRRVSAIVFVALLTLILAACRGAAASPPPIQAPATPAASAPAPSVGPAAAIDTDELVKTAAAKDGQAVRVSGYFLASGDTAQLCSLLLESLPPQCGGGTVRITGEVSGDVLSRLDKTTEPDLKQATWGWVVVEGTFRASGADGQPTIELGQVMIPAG